MARGWTFEIGLNFSHGHEYSFFIAYVNVFILQPIKYSSETSFLMNMMPRAYNLYSLILHSHVTKKKLIGYNANVKI